MFRVFSSIPVYDYETRVGVLNGSHGLSLSSSETPHLLHLGLVVAQHSGLVQDGVYVSS